MIHDLNHDLPNFKMYDQEYPDWDNPMDLIYFITSYSVESREWFCLLLNINDTDSSISAWI